MDNKLAVIVRESGLEATKAQILLTKFQNSFALAAEWEAKAKMLVVTNDDQIADMKIARIGRLALRAERITIENTRKDLKAEALREGKAIDGIANVLKALIVPIEEYLDKQEKFIELKAEAEAEAKRLEEEKKAEEDRIAKEKAEAEEQERIRKENKQLLIDAEKNRKEAEEKDKAMQVEREETEAREEQIKEKAKAAQEKLKRESEKKLAVEKAKREKAEEKARKEKEKAQAIAEADRKEKERLAEILKNQIECPACGHKFQLKKK